MMQATNVILQKIKNQKVANTPECAEFVMMLMAIMDEGSKWCDTNLRPMVEKRQKEEELKKDLSNFNWDGLLKDKDNGPAS